MKRITRKEIEAIKSPEFTKSWHPISHKAVLAALAKVIKKAGVKIRDESYSTKHDGMSMFGRWVLDIPFGKNGSSYPQLGIRNSMAKKFALGLCAGDYVTACSNGQFSGDFVTFRKHTGKLDIPEIEALSEKAFAQIVEDSKKLHDWHEGLRKVDLPENDFKQLTYDAMVNKIIAPNRFSAFIDAHQEEVVLAKKEETLYQFHGAVTRLAREDNLLVVAKRTGLLNRMCDDHSKKAA